MAKTTRTGKNRQAALTLDGALIALVIAAMNANEHVAADEAARAHHLIWSTRRFRRKSGEAVGKVIQDMRSLVEETGADAVITRACRVIPARLRPAAFAVLVDVLLADGKLERSERRFLRNLGDQLELDEDAARQIVDVVALKNQL